MTRDLTPQALLGLSRGFMESRVLLSGADLDLFTLTADQPKSAAELAEETGYQLRPLTYLLDALAAMGLLVKTDETYRTPVEAAPLLRSDSSTSIRPMLLHASSIWERWSDLTRIVRETGRAERKEAGLFEDPQELEAFIGAMHVVGSMMADRVAARVDPGSARRLLDVGGGSGTYTIAFLKTSPELTATIFDRPPVVEMARRRLEDEELLGRVELVGGDFYQDEFPPGHDLVWLSAIIHQNSPEQNLDLYRKIHRAMTPGGRLVIRDHVMSEDRTEPESGALFAINMLVGTPGGGTYTFEEIRDGLIAAGFDRVQLLDRSQPMGGLVEAFKS